MNSSRQLPILNFVLLVLLVLAQHQTLAGDESPATPPDSSDSGRLQSIIKEGVHPKLRWSRFPDYQTQLEQLYAATGARLLWTRDGRPSTQASALIQTFAASEEFGLDPADFDAEPLAAWVATLQRSSSADEFALFDVAVSLTAMRFITSIYSGRVNPHNVDYGLDIEPKRLDLPTKIQELANAPDVPTAVADYEPKLSLYKGLKSALAQYRKLNRELQNAEFEFPNKFKPGAKHSQIPMLRSMLTTLGDLPSEDVSAAANNGETYDSALANAVKRFQRRHGLTADGIIGKTTTAELNMPLTARIQQIELSLERLRWLPVQIDGPHLMVNIPSFQLFGFLDHGDFGRPDLTMDVIVGQAIDKRNTPVFQADMEQVIFRPYWNVPYAITVKEIVPILQKNPGYLGRQDMEIVERFGPKAQSFAASAENIGRLYSGSLKLRQRPGKKNALGLVKFVLPNNNNVYLHSTPSKQLFQRTRRDFSHGCIRVADPVKLAEFVLRDFPAWNKESIAKAMNGAESKTVNLKAALPVYIFYSTVLVTGDGDVRFFDDLYGHDEILQGLLDKGFPYPG